MSVTRFDTQDRVRDGGGHAQSTVLTQAEAVLQHQQEMLSQSEKLAALSSLLASMAHELHNPLAAIMLQSELLLEEITDMALMEPATHIHDAAERCVRIVRNFLMLARQSAPERTQVQLNRVIAEALQLCAYALRLDNIDVSQHLADDLPALWADAQQLSQVVVNLLVNAHYALRETPTPRRLTLITRFDPAHRQVVLHVADTGPGIPPEIQGSRKGVAMTLFILILILVAGTVYFFPRLARVLLGVVLCGLCVGAVWVVWNIVIQDVLRREQTHTTRQRQAAWGDARSDTATAEEAAQAIQRLREQIVQGGASPKPP